MSRGQFQRGWPEGSIKPPQIPILGAPNVRFYSSDTTGQCIDEMAIDWRLIYGFCSQRMVIAIVWSPGRAPSSLRPANLSRYLGCVVRDQVFQNSLIVIHGETADAYQYQL